MLCLCVRLSWVWLVFTFTLRALLFSSSFCWDQIVQSCWLAVAFLADSYVISVSGWKPHMGTFWTSVMAWCTFLTAWTIKKKKSILLHIHIWETVIMVVKWRIWHFTSCLWLIWKLKEKARCISFALFAAFTGSCPILAAIDKLADVGW